MRVLLESVQRGETELDTAFEVLKNLPFTDLGYAKVDHHRALRQGVPEVIFAEGKTVDHIVGIATELSRHGNVLITRVPVVMADELEARLEGLVHHKIARIATIEKHPITRVGESPVAVVCAGTSDAPVAEEAAETLRMLGLAVERMYDVGVAGVHRLLAGKTVLDKCSVVIVVAGMEGALPSAVGGLVSMPVIAVPTSVGYGAALKGFAALAGMLTSCASGITVCNIDNGFGAAFAAARIVKTAGRY